MKTKKERSRKGYDQADLVLSIRPNIQAEVDRIIERVWNDKFIEHFTRGRPDFVDQIREKEFPDLIKRWLRYHVTQSISSKMERPKAEYRKELKKVSRELTTAANSMKDLSSGAYDHIMITYAEISGLPTSLLQRPQIHEGLSQKIEALYELADLVDKTSDSLKPQRGRPTDFLQRAAILDLAWIYQHAFGRQPGRSFDNYAFEPGADPNSGPFVEFVRCANSLITPEIKLPIETIRYVIDVWRENPLECAQFQTILPGDD